MTNKTSKFLLVLAINWEVLDFTKHKFCKVHTFNFTENSIKLCEVVFSWYLRKLSSSVSLRTYLNSLFLQNSLVDLYLQKE